MALSEKPKILVFIDWFLPGYKSGGPVRSCANLMQHLSEYYDFYVITRDRDYCEESPYGNVKVDAWNNLDGMQVYYASPANTSLKGLKSIAAQVPFDRVYVNGIYSLRFSIFPLLIFKGQDRKKVVVATRGMLAPSAIQVKRTKKRLFLWGAKMMGLYKGITFHVTNRKEAKEVQEEVGSNAITLVAPNLPKKYKDVQGGHRTKSTGSVKLVNVARIAPEKNLKYALEQLSKATGKIEFDIYGPIYDEAYWDECQEVIQSMPRNITVQYKSSVHPDELQKTLSGYHFMYMPTRGENFGHIILESLVAGCPVIISDKTPWLDLQKLQIGWDIRLAQKDRFTEVLNECAEMSQESYSTLSEKAHQYAWNFVQNKEAVQQSRQLFVNS